MRYRCSWTYMRKCEKHKAQFLKPKKRQMFSEKEDKTVQKGRKSLASRLHVARC